MRVILLKFKLFTISFFLISSLSAQYSLSDMVLNSDAVIEGTVTEQECYRDSETGNIMTINMMNVHKIFKGEIVGQQIKIVTEGGIIDNLEESWSHNFILGIGETGVLFLRDMEKTENTFLVVRDYHGYISFRNSGSSSPIGVCYDKVYNNIENEIFEQLEKLTNQRKIITLSGYEKEVIEQSIKLSGTQCIEYKLSNLQINASPRGSNQPSYLNFDIEVRAPFDPFNLHSTVLLMEYSTDILGENVVSANRISVARGAAYESYALNVYDAESNKVGVDISKVSNGTAIEVNSFYNNLYHADIEVQTFDLNALLQLSVDENFDLITYQEDENGIVSEIGCSEFNENVNISVSNLVAPDIQDWNSELTAGTRTLLTISGDHFGNNQNAFNHSMDEWIKPYSGDYKSWSDDFIEVYVPTYAQSAITNGPIGADRNYAGSGKFRVVKFDGFDEEDLVITYAVKNDLYNLQSQPVFMTNENGNNGYTVALSPEFASKTDGPMNTGNKFSNAFERALDTWCEETGLNFILDYDAFNSGIYDILVSLEENPIALIRPASTLITRYNTNCTVTIDNGSANHPETFESDFINSAEIKFRVDEDNVPWDAGQNSTAIYSVENVALHELGHAHGLLHTNQPEDLMYYSSNTNQVSQNSVNASTYIRDHSESHDCQNGSYSRLFSCTTSIEEHRRDLNIGASIISNQIVIFNPEGIDIENIEMFSMSGYKVMEFTNSIIKYNKQEIAQNLPNGVYILKLNTKLGFASFKCTLIE